MLIANRSAAENTSEVEIKLTNGDTRSFVDVERVDLEDSMLVIQLDESRGIYGFPLGSILEWSMQ